MEIQFIGQNIPDSKAQTTGQLLIDSLTSKEYNSFYAFVAFVSKSGICNLAEELQAFQEKGKSIQFFLGIDLHATSKEALEQLLEYNIKSHVIYSPNSIIYHPKIYIFEGAKSNRIIIGSSNFTAGGLFRNIEASVCCDFTNSDVKGQEFLGSICDQYNSIICGTHSSCQELTPDLLRLLLEAKVVFPKLINRIRNNKTSKSFSKKSTSAEKSLMGLFNKMDAPRPPKGYMNIVSKKVYENEDSEINVHDEIVQLREGTMWIETGMMTGGSRNILDLSKSGSNAGKTKFGSVNFFDINSDDMVDAKNIDVVINGKKYIGNTIFYAEGNSNWRMRLNGKTDNDEKLTDISKPNLGAFGGFQQKILLFTKIDTSTYELEILSKSELEKLIDRSSDWAKGGSEGNGRAYGII